jgi:hypothetical protein
MKKIKKMEKNKMKLKTNVNILNRIKEIKDDFLEKYDLGEVSNLVIVNDPAGNFNFEPLSGDNNYLGTELVLHSTLSGVEVGLTSQWI